MINNSHTIDLRVHYQVSFRKTVTITCLDNRSQQCVLTPVTQHTYRDAMQQDIIINPSSLEK